MTAIDVQHTAGSIRQGFRFGQALCALLADAEHMGRHGEQILNLLTSLFAVTLPEEFHRVLGEDGLFFQVLAAEDHLLGLKSIIYPELKFKEKTVVPNLPGFELLKSIPVRFDFTVEGEQVQNLFSMTPHVFRIGKEGADRLRQTARLSDTASCVLNVYRKV